MKKTQASHLESQNSHKKMENERKTMSNQKLDAVSVNQCCSGFQVIYNRVEIAKNCWFESSPGHKDPAIKLQGFLFLYMYQKSNTYQSWYLLTNPSKSSLINSQYFC